MKSTAFTVHKNGSHRLPTPATPNAAALHLQSVLLVIEIRLPKTAQWISTIRFIPHRAFSRIHHASIHSLHTSTLVVVFPSAHSPFSKIDGHRISKNHGFSSFGPEFTLSVVSRFCSPKATLFMIRHAETSHQRGRTSLPHDFGSIYFTFGNIHAMRFQHFFYKVLCRIAVRLLKPLQTLCNPIAEQSSQSVSVYIGPLT